ncbi:MAG: proline--tRNA ligase [Chloroflexi bacterium]|nr:proline--tRNA ligase [Anaerolineaceae bacterium]NMB89939.1 proline--tRNA ligase [Chloroflexota bacterium]
MSNLFGQTLREAPSEAQTAGHQLLLRAGFIRQMAAGVFAYLPLAKRSLHKIETILRQEMDAIGGQEVSLPVVLPADIWQESGRWYQIGAEMGRFRDRNERDMVLAMTHEEAVADLVRRDIRSHRQLPALIYQIQTKWRDDPRPRAGLIRVREFTMKDSYSLDTSWEGLEKQYRANYQAYFNIFARCGLPVIAVKADTGMMGGKIAHEFIYLTPIGEDTLILCPHCGYSANRQIARFRKPEPGRGEPEAVEKVATPGVSTIEDLSTFLAMPKSGLAKAVFMTAEIQEGDAIRSQLVFAVVRGDMELNETKLSNAVKARDLHPSTEEEIRAIGAVPGYASPIGVHGALVVVDDLVADSTNLAAGANQSGYHLLNTNFPRDYQADLVTDIAAAQEGYACPQCGNPLDAQRGVETGNIFQLGTRYSSALGCNFQDEHGDIQPVIMGSYGIGVGRLFNCVAEEHHDEHGLQWPITVAPFQVHLIALSGKKDPGATRQQAEWLYTQLLEAGIEVLFDDRDESPGVKFNDADLIGIPIRLTSSERSLAAGGFELKLRSQQERQMVSQAEVVHTVTDLIARLTAAVLAGVHPVAYQD